MKGNNFETEPVQNPSQQTDDMLDENNASQSGASKAEDGMCDIYLSLCGNVLCQKYIEEQNLKEEEMFQIFEDPEYLITEENYVQNPAEILANPNLMVCIEDQIYRYQDAL